MKHKKTIEELFNTTYKERFFKSEKTNHSLFATLINLCLHAKKINCTAFRSMQIAKKYEEEYIRTHEDFKNFGNMWENVLKCISELNIKKTKTV